MRTSSTGVSKEERYTPTGSVLTKTSREQPASHRSAPKQEASGRRCLRRSDTGGLPLGGRGEIQVPPQDHREGGGVHRGPRAAQDAGALAQGGARGAHVVHEQQSTA